MKYAFFTLLTAFPFLANAQDIPKLTLNASATIAKPADQFQLKIGVVTYGESAQLALAENNEKMNRVLEDLQRAGLEKEDYETHQFSINPTYTPMPKDPPPFWKQSINGYEVSNTIQIHTPKLEMATEIIDIASEAGANNISDIRFGLHDSRDYWEEVLTLAGQNAVADARAIARATGVDLVRVLSVSLNQKQVKSPHLSLAACGKMSGTPIEAGDVSMEASVSIVYEITN